MNRTNQISALLSAYGVSHDEIQCHNYEQGDDNLNVFFSVNKKNYVLRCYKVTTREEIKFELDLITYLAERGFPTARVFRAKNGSLVGHFNGLPAALFEFVEGNPIDRTRVDSGIQVARIIARLHKETAGHSFEGTRSRSDFGRLRALDGMCVKHSAFRNKRGMEEFCKTANTVLQNFEAALTKLQDPLPWGIVHHDVNPDNILVDTRNQIVALLDFDEAHNGYLIFDLAGIIHNYGMDAHQRIDVAKCKQIVGAYNDVRTMSNNETAMLPYASLILFASDAAEYLIRSFLKNPDKAQPRNCLSLRAFYHQYRDYNSVVL